jgi:putative transcriptional regulator
MKCSVTNIHVERAKYRISQKELGDAVGVSTQTMHAIEVGKNKNPSVDLAMKIARFFNTTVEYLFKAD